MQPKYLERFLARIERSEGCWTWAGAHTTAGYSETWDGQRVLYAHRVAYELWVGPIPTGLSIDHLCRNPGCVNPHHLQPVTTRTNVRRGIGPTAANARATHCKRGHVFDDANTYLDTRGQRVCRPCGAERRRERSRRLGLGVPFGERTHCPQGHPYDAVNTYVDKRGYRSCKECGRISSRERARARARRSG